MARSDRLLRLLQVMRMKPAPVTAASLAEETGVSLRSVYRDIDSLRRAGARIEGERGYGYWLVEDLALPPQMLDRDEMEALALGLAQGRAMGDKTLARAADSVLAKIAASLPEGRAQHLFHAVSQVYRPEPCSPSSPDMDRIRAACFGERALRIGYRDRHSTLTTRRILPAASRFWPGAACAKISACFGATGSPPAKRTGRASVRAGSPCCAPIWRSCAPRPPRASDALHHPSPW